MVHLHSTHSNPLFLGGQSVGQDGLSAEGSFSLSNSQKQLGRRVVGMLGVT